MSVFSNHRCFGKQHCAGFIQTKLNLLRSRIQTTAYRWAWADGEPYVNRYELTKTTELLEQMNVPIPDLPPYDPAKDEPFPWEADVRAAIEKLRAEKEAKEKGEESA